MVAELERTPPRVTPLPEMPDHPRPAPWDQLTEMQVWIAQLCTVGWTLDEAAAEVCVNVGSVRRMMHAARLTVGAATMTDLCCMGVRAHVLFARDPSDC